MSTTTEQPVRHWRLASMAQTLTAIPTNKWLPIAYRVHIDSEWIEVPGAPITTEEAHELEHDGLICMANRREAHATALVVKRRVA